MATTPKKFVQVLLSSTNIETIYTSDSDKAGIVRNLQLVNTGSATVEVSLWIATSATVGVVLSSVELVPQGWAECGLTFIIPADESMYARASASNTVVISAHGAEVG